MLGDVEEDQRFLVADAVIHSPGCLGCLCGVLGDVGGHCLLGEVFAVAERTDGLDIELRPPPQHPIAAEAGLLIRGHDDFDPGGGSANGVVEQVEGGPGRGR